MTIAHLKKKMKNEINAYNFRFNSNLIQKMLFLFREEIKDNYVTSRRYLTVTNSKDKLKEEMKILKKELIGYRQLYKAVKFRCEDD